MGRLITCARLRNSRSTGCPEAPVGVGTVDQALRVSWAIGAYAVSPRVAHERSPTAAVENQAAAVGVRTDSVGRGPESAIPERSATCGMSCLCGARWRSGLGECTEVQLNDLRVVGEIFAGTCIRILALV